MKTIKNSITLSGVTYTVRRIRYIPGISPSPCDKCGILGQCLKEDLQTCRIFNEGSRLAYFVKES